MASVCDNCDGNVEMKIKFQGSDDTHTMIVCKAGYTSCLYSVYGGGFEYNHTTRKISPAISQCSEES